MATKQEQIEKEMSELKRVGSQLFNSYLSPELVQFDMNVIDKPLMPDNTMISETTLKKLDEDNKLIKRANEILAKRVKRANEILARINNIDYSLGLMADLPEVQITSLNRAGWSPKIPTDKIKEFVGQIYREERESLIAELEKLYPTSETEQILKWDYLPYSQIWFARSVDNSNWEIMVNDQNMFTLIDNNGLPYTTAPFETLRGAQKWCEECEIELIEQLKLR